MSVTQARTDSSLQHDYLEEKKRKAMKAGKKAAKLAKKESEEGKEVSHAFHVCARVESDG